MSSDDNFHFELKLENSLRKLPWLLPFISITTGLFLLSCIIICLHYFKSHHYWVIIPAGMLAHAFFIVIVHDGAHKSITRTKFDRLIMNLGCGLMLLPFYGEPFRKYHLIHHGNTNAEIDPLWPPEKKYLYTNNRWFYILCECVPLLFTFYLVVKSGTRKPALQKKAADHAPTVNTGYILIAACVSALIIFLFPPRFGLCWAQFFFSICSEH